MNDPTREWLDALPLRWDPPPLRRWLLAAVALGITGDTLLRAEPGLGLGIWLTALLLVGAGLARARGALGRGRAAILGLGVAAALALAVRSAPPLQLLAIALVGLSTAWWLLERPWVSGLVPRLAAGLAAGLSALGLTPVGAMTASGGGADVSPGWSRRWAVAARATVVAAPVLLVVGGLFVAGDPVFARYAGLLLEAGLERVVSHLALALLLAWVGGGLVLAMAAVRVDDVWVRPGPVKTYAAEAIVALLLVGLLFAAFLGVQARALFGGRAFVEATVGMTYAEYARSGFFQLVVAAMVALPTVLAADWVVGPASRHRRAFVGSAYGLVTGIVLVLASAAHRMALYVDAYGLTEARIYASAIMAWLAVAAVWLAVTIAGRRTERFAAGALVAGWAVFLSLVAVNPAGVVVRVNADRAAAREGPGFDVRYGLSALGTDAVPALVDAVDRLPPEEACRVAGHLTALRLEDDPRSWTVSRWRARRALAAGGAEIRAASTVGCRENGGPSGESRARGEPMSYIGIDTAGTSRAGPVLATTKRVNLLRSRPRIQ